MMNSICYFEEECISRLEEMENRFYGNRTIHMKDSQDEFQTL